MASFLDQAFPDTGSAMDPITGLPRTTVAKSPVMYGDDTGSADYWGVNPQTSTAPAAAAPASPAAAAPSFAEEPGLNMGADAGGEVGTPKSFVGGDRTAAYAPAGSQQADALAQIQQQNPSATTFAAQNYNRVGGKNINDFTAGMSPAAKAAVQALLAPRPNATATFNGQSFVMPGGNYVDPMAARQAAAQADLQTQQQQTQAVQAKKDAYTNANSPSAIEAQKAKDAQDLWKLQHPAPQPLTPAQQKLKDLQDQNALDAATPAGQGYKDAQQLIGKLDITNPQHQPIIAQLQGLPKTAQAIPAPLMQSAGQLLHPAPAPGQQVMASLGGASKILDGSPDLQQQLAQLAQKVTTGHVSVEDQYSLHAQRVAIEQEMVRRGADPTAAHLAVRATLQKAAPSFVQAPPTASGGVGQWADEAIQRQKDAGGFLGSGVSLAEYNPVYSVARYMSRGHDADIAEKQRKASFLNE